MKKLLCILFVIIPLLSWGQDMRVYTVAGSLTATALGDGGPATDALLGSTEGVWMDKHCNIYLTSGNTIRKVSSATGIITTIAGNGYGFSGDNEPATNAKLRGPYGMYIDSLDNLYFVDQANNRVRKVNATTGIITTVAGGATTLGDGDMATNAMLTFPQNVYGDDIGNLYIGEKGRIRKINAATGIISTIAGNGIPGLSGDNGLATNAQVWLPTTILFDSNGNILFADRANSRIRKIDNISGIITTIAGTSSGYSGDNALAINAQLNGPLSFVIDCFGNIVIGDNGNNVLRKIDATTGKITTIAGVGTSSVGSTAEGASALAADIHPEFLYLDLYGNIYFSNYGGQIRKITNYNAGQATSGSRCGTVGIASLQQRTDHKIRIFPNPAAEALTINVDKDFYTWVTIVNDMGIVFVRQPVKSNEITIDVNSITPGLYYVIVTDVNNVIHVEKIVKQ